MKSDSDEAIRINPFRHVATFSELFRTRKLKGKKNFAFAPIISLIIRRRRVETENSFVEKKIFLIPFELDKT